MADWTAGYVADVEYVYGYYPELNPLRARLALLLAGWAVPEVTHACELGFGQGLSINLHAAASLVDWWGTDFNPAQAGFAQALARSAGSGARLFDDAFEEFCQRKDLPEFDYIGLHGIWSWISDANRAVIVDFVRRRLRVGGVLYISYNTQPGWAQMLPLRQLLAEYATTMVSPAHDSIARVNSALDFAERMFATNPAFIRNNPVVVDRLVKMKKQDRHYLAHEYFNSDWHPMPFARTAECLKPAKLGFACSAWFADHVDILNLSNEQQTFLLQLPDSNFRQSVRDFMVNQQFRRDYWVKGLRRLSAIQQAEHLRAMGFMMIKPRKDIDLNVSGALGSARLNEDVYLPLLDLLADHRVRTLQKIERDLQRYKIGYQQLAQALTVLVSKGVVAPVQERQQTDKQKAATDRMNTVLMDKARHTQDIACLASPVTGGGINLDRVQQLFVLSMKDGSKDASALAAGVWNLLSAQGQRLVDEGQPLQSEEENLNFLMKRATKFLADQVGLFKALQIMQ